MKRAACVTLMFLFFCSSLCAQQYAKLLDSIAQRIEWFGIKNQNASLFVHFDKTVYANSESAWFTGYIVRSNSNAVHHTLSVVLIRNDDHSVLSEAKYVMDKGLAFGNMVLPDSMPTGNYSFVCYTNILINGFPAALFVQPVTIKAGTAAGFNATLSLTDSIKPGMDSATVLLKAMTRDYTLVKKAAVKYFIGGREHPLKSGTLKTDNFGEARITIPLKTITAANNVLQTEIDNGNTVKNFSIKLPVYKKETRVKFYPEGGNLVAGAVNTVGWEVVNSEGDPVQVSAALYQDDQLLETINTGIYGMGRFTVVPKTGSSYKVKIIYPANDSVYTLPAVTENGITINVPEALATDTLQLNVQGAAGPVLLLLHDYQNTYINTSFILSGERSTLVKVPLTEVPRGLVTITLLDSLGRPEAERIFFAHFDKKPEVQVSTDSSSYASRQKIDVKLKVTGADGKPLKGLVSVACVQANRLELAKASSIDSYTYLNSVLEDLPFKKNLLANDTANKKFLEQVLLVKGWRRYTWRDVMNVKATDTLLKIVSLRFTGKVVHTGSKIKRPLLLNVKNFVTPKLSELDIVSTDSTGNFELLPEKITGEPNRKLTISVRSEEQMEYIVSVNDPYKETSKKLATALAFPDYSPKSFAQTSQAFVLKPGETAKTLSTVVIATKTDNSFYNSREPGINVCGDYVCQNGILNCTNHPNDGFQPVVGRSYGVRYGGNTIVQTIYRGCTALEAAAKNEYQVSMAGIFNRREFYVTDLSKTDPTDPQFLPTLYWNYSIVTNEAGEAQFSFYSSDIAGKFRLVVQGITADNLLYGEQSFDVREQR